MRSLAGVVQHYAWGDPAALPRILGQPADGRPWAEWWLGTHPAAPSHLDGGASLSSVAGELPYLLKLLAAAAPLSLQTHPDAPTALAGFDREQSAGIALDDPRRVYRDPFAKPELLCALTPFDTLCGFRPPATPRLLLHRLGARTSWPPRCAMTGSPATVARLYRGELAGRANHRGLPAGSPHRRSRAAGLRRSTPGTRASPAWSSPCCSTGCCCSRARRCTWAPATCTPTCTASGSRSWVRATTWCAVASPPSTSTSRNCCRCCGYEPLPDPVVHPVEALRPLALPHPGGTVRAVALRRCRRHVRTRPPGASSSCAPTATSARAAPWRGRLPGAGRHRRAGRPASSHHRVPPRDPATGPVRRSSMQPPASAETTAPDR